MGSGGLGQFISGLKIGVLIQVGLSLLPMLKGLVHSGYAHAYASDTRGSLVPITDPSIIARNIQRQQFKISNANRPPSLTHRERGGRRGVFDDITSHRFVDDQDINVGITGFPAFTNMLQHYHGMMGGRAR
jgi:hypothetical protein